MFAVRYTANPAQDLLQTLLMAGILVKDCGKKSRSPGSTRDTFDRWQHDHHRAGAKTKPQHDRTNTHPCALTNTLGQHNSKKIQQLSGVAHCWVSLAYALPAAAALEVLLLHQQL